MRIPAVVLDPVAPCQALLAIADLDQRPRPPADTLREAFKLTPAEVRIAQLIASGESLDDAAEILGIQRETARVQLKAVFSKTDTHRQGELVALMASLLGARIAST
jgi:DNA-binding CsgD family transcriptional regulator